MTLTIYEPNGTKRIYSKNSDYSTDRVSYDDADIERIFKEYARLPDFTAIISG
jgi:hypothetical protein